MSQHTEFVIFDVETTGLSPAGGDRVIEIAALRVCGQKAVAEFHFLVNPERMISYGAFCVNGISQDMVAAAPKAREVFPSFLEFAGDAHLVGHNVDFDLGFLLNELFLIGVPWRKNRICLDTLRMARIFFPGLASYSLGSLARALRIPPVQQHRAMADVQLTWRVFSRLTEQALQKESMTMEAMFRRFGQQKIFV